MSEVLVGGGGGGGGCVMLVVDVLSVCISGYGQPVLSPVPARRVKTMSSSPAQPVRAAR